MNKKAIQGMVKAIKTDMSVVDGNITGGEDLFYSLAPDGVTKESTEAHMDHITLYSAATLQAVAEYASENPVDNPSTICGEFALAHGLDTNVVLTRVEGGYDPMLEVKVGFCDQAQIAYENALQWVEDNLDE